MNRRNQHLHDEHPQAERATAEFELADVREARKAPVIVLDAAGAALVEPASGAARPGSRAFRIPS